HTLSITSALVMSGTIVEGTSASQSNGLRRAGGVARLPSPAHMLRPDFGAQSGLEAVLHGRAERVGFTVRQGAIRCAQRQADRDALLSGGHLGATVDVEQRHVLEQPFVIGGADL